MSQVEGVRAFVRLQTAPVIVVGEFNATPTNREYGILTSVLHDAWANAGTGLGHTFPSEVRPNLFGIDVPRHLVRLDYVFYSPHWTAIDARIVPSEPGSDHRPVSATLQLVQ